jgi:hypothetical protein
LLLLVKKQMDTMRKRIVSQAVAKQDELASVVASRLRFSAKNNDQIVGFMGIGVAVMCYIERYGAACIDP